MTSGAGGTSAFFQQTNPFEASYTSTPFLTGPNPTSLLLTGPRLPISSSMLPQLDISLKRADYPGVRFWTKPEWMHHLKNLNTYGTEKVRGRTLVSQGINKTARYIEDGSGNTVDGYKLKDMLTHMRLIWSSLLLLNRAPATWGKADMEIVHQFRSEMRVKFPEFALCENDWKADYLATTHYPSWYSNHVRGVSFEDVDIGADRPAQSKRPAAERSTGEPKRKMKKVIIVCSHTYSWLIYQLSLGGGSVFQLGTSQPH
jgi:hypothetical protein